MNTQNRFPNWSKGEHSIVVRCLKALRDDFDEDGFVVVRGLFDQTEISLKAQLEQRGII